MNYNFNLIQHWELKHESVLLANYNTQLTTERIEKLSKIYDNARNRQGDGSFMIINNKIQTLIDKLYSQRI